jgi:Golgi nucleoside diphosphatase
VSFSLTFGNSSFSSSQSSSSPVRIDNADCLPRGYSANYTRDNRLVTITGEGDFQSCSQALVTLLNLNATCKRAPCSVNGVYQPTINYEAHDFYGFSEFWYTMEGSSSEKRIRHVRFVV